MITYAEQAALATDMVFRGRVQVACVKYADSITLEASNVTAHTSRMRWAAKVVENPVAVAQAVQQQVINDPKVVDAGADISDADLQSATETTINSKFI